LYNYLLSNKDIYNKKNNITSYYKYINKNLNTKLLDNNFLFDITNSLSNNNTMYTSLWDLYNFYNQEII
jgi:hypothetical protein